MNQYEALAPEITYDALCELCDEDAMPFDASVEYGFCPEHAMQMWAGVGREDFDIDADAEKLYESYKAHRGELEYQQRCAWSSYCPNTAVPYIKDYERGPEVLRGAVNLCPVHAMEMFGPDHLQTMLVWVVECEPGYWETVDDSA